jgi:hypothetical protein
MIRDFQIRDKFADVIINDEILSVIDFKNSPTGKTGNTRRVFIGKNYVVKFGGHLGEAFLEIEPEDRDYFAEVVLVDIDRRWLVQRRVNCVPNFEHSWDEWTEVLEMAQKYDVGDVAYLQGYEPHNWAVDISGQPVIFDYDFNGNSGQSDGFQSWQIRDSDPNAVCFVCEQYECVCCPRCHNEPCECCPVCGELHECSCCLECEMKVCECEKKD